MKRNNHYEFLKNNLDAALHTIFVTFNKKFNIDYQALKKHFSILCNQNHTKFLYLMPYNGRYSQLSNNEIFELNKFNIKKVKKRKK